jgi:putative serine protease PepD
MIAVLVLLIGVVGAGAFAFADARKQNAALRSDITQLRNSNGLLGQDLTDSRTAVSELAKRMGALESRVNNTPDPTKITAEAAKSVFSIHDSQGGLGSGFVLQSTGGRSLLATNYHVVEDTWEAGDREVQVTRGDETYDATILEVAVDDDVALLEVIGRLQALRISTTKPKVGSTVYALGSPLGLAGTVTSGIVSAYRELDGVEFLQYSAPTNPGNSGGPIIDATGRAVGIHMGRFEASAAGLGLAIPIARACLSISAC